MAGSSKNDRRSTCHEGPATGRLSGCASSRPSHTSVCTAHVPRLLAENTAGMSTWMAVTLKAHKHTPESTAVAPCNELRRFIGSTACGPLNGIMSPREEPPEERTRSPLSSGLVERLGKLSTLMTSGERFIGERAIYYRKEAFWQGVATGGCCVQLRLHDQLVRVHFTTFIEDQGPGTRNTMDRL